MVAELTAELRIVETDNSTDNRAQRAQRLHNQFEKGGNLLPLVGQGGNTRGIAPVL